MNQNLVEMLHLELEPVGIYFGNTTAQCDLQADPSKRNCVMAFVHTAARGKVVSIPEFFQNIRHITHNNPPLIEKPSDFFREIRRLKFC